MNLDPAELRLCRAAVRYWLAAHRQAHRPAPEGAEQLCQHLDSIITAPASAIGSDDRPMPDAWEGSWATTAEAARLLGTTERWAREIAPGVGGVKRYGRWWLPRQALPEDEN